MQAIRFLGMKLTPGTMEEIHQEISRLLGRKRQSFMLSANVHSFNLVRRLPWLARFYDQADIVYLDGAGVVFAARWLGYQVPDRLTMADWGGPAARYLADRGHSLFLLGNAPGVAELAAARLKAQAPELHIAGTHHGFFVKHGQENQAVVEAINRCRPDVLMVGLGMPLEQRWILDNHQAIEARVFWEVGAAFGYWAGLTPRCPAWMGRAGLEWLFRLWLEPRRMGRRYVVGNLAFLCCLLKARWAMGKEFLREEKVQSG